MLVFTQKEKYNSIVTTNIKLSESTYRNIALLILKIINWGGSMIKRKRVMSLVIAAAICIGGSTNIFADESSDYIEIKQEIINHMIKVNNQMGLIMTEEDIKELNITVDQMCEDENGEDKTSVAKQYLEELLQEAPLSDNISVNGGNDDDIGWTELPKSTRADIFFTDNSKPYNHVGMYISSASIIESMPKDGVQYWGISNKESWQSTVSGTNNSCILRVSGITDTKFTNIIEWAKDQKGKTYDDDFLDNKANTTNENKKFNCSELVWKAYKYKASKDLDSNGGAAVYPNNIKNSSLTKYVKSF